MLKDGYYGYNNCLIILFLDFIGSNIFELNVEILYSNFFLVLD